MNTDARRRASAAYHARRSAEGARKVTLWLGEEARAKLEACKAEAGSKDRAAELAILAWDPVSKGPPKPSKPVVKHTPKSLAKQPKVADNVDPVRVSVQVGPTSFKPGERLKKR